MTQSSTQDLFADWAKNCDALSRFVQVAGLQGVVLSSLELGAPWRMGATEGAEPVLHFVQTGTAFLDATASTDPIELNAGDVLMLPRGGQYMLTDTYPSTVPEVLPIEMPYNRAMCSIRLGGRGAITKITCCAYRFQQATLSAPLLSFLPPLIVLRKGPASEDVRATLLELVGELGTRRMGSDGIVARLAELAYLRVLRDYVGRESSAERGLLGALTDPQIGRALQQIHGSLADPWTVASLAASVGMSRAAFADLFTRKAGVSPMRYLQQCRIQEAARLITTTDLAFAEIGRRVGYSDATAFSRAFRRETGRSAREYRRTPSELEGASTE